MELDLKAIQQEKVNKCDKEISEVLKKYDLTLKPIIVTTQEGIFPSVAFLNTSTPENGDK